MYAFQKKVPYKRSMEAETISDLNNFEKELLESNKGHIRNIVYPKNYK